MSFAKTLSLCILLLLSACDGSVIGFQDTGNPDADASEKDAGQCLPPKLECGDNCCDEKERCEEGQCLPCEPSCAPGSCEVPDGCGGSCSCEGGLFCNEQHQCQEECTESSAAFCLRLTKECGTFSGTDLCGEPRTADCGECTLPERCNTETNQCSCTPAEKAVLCGAASAQCGSISVADDGCGTPIPSLDCGTCSELANCEADHRCHCKETDVQICARLSRNCGALQALDECGDYRHIPDCSFGVPCGTGNECVNNSCATIGTVPSNDSCGAAGASAIELVLDPEGKITFETDTTHAGPSASGRCQPNSLNDVVYALRLAKESSLKLVATPANGSLTRPNLYLRSSCADPATEIGCALSPSAGAPAELAAPSAGPGLVYLWIDSGGLLQADAGRQTITIEATPVSAPINPNCAEALPILNPKKELFLELEGTTVGATHPSEEELGRCALTGRDVYYSFTMPDDEEHLVVATVWSTDSHYAPGIALLRACSGEERELSCLAGDPAHPHNRLQVSVPRLPPDTTYYLRISGVTSVPGNFAATLEFFAPIDNDSCEQVESGGTHLDLGPSFSKTITGRTDVANDNVAVSCTGQSADEGRDVVYSFDVPAGKSRNVAVTLKGIGGAYLPTFSVRSDCYAKSSELLCATPSDVAAPDPTETLSRRLFALRPGTYHLIVDSFKGSGGEFELQISMPERGAAPANDSCAAASEHSLNPVPPTWRTEGVGNTLDATNDLDPSFATDSGADVVYSISPTEDSSLHFYMRRSVESPEYKPILYLLSDCADASSVVASNSSSAEEMELRANLSGGSTYFLVVDSADRSEGAFSYELFLLPQVTNVSCTDAADLGFTASELSREALSDNSFGTSSANSICTVDGGSDLYWKLTVPGTGYKDLSVSFEIPAASRFEPSVSLRSLCQVAETERACARLERSEEAVFTAYKLLGGETYTLLVDGQHHGADGPFLLKAALSPSTLSTNDLCSSALPFPTVGPKQVEGNTRESTNHTLAYCEPRSIGGDLVYRLSLPTDRDSNVLLTLTPSEGSQLIPILYVRASCEPAALDKECLAGSAGVPLTTTLTRVTGELYIFVDSASARDEGAFTLSAEVTEPGTPPANDTCSSPQDLGPGGPITLPFHKLLSGVSTVSAGAEPELVGTCATTSALHNGRDLVYALDVPTQARLTARVRRHPTTPSFIPAVYIRKASCTSTDPLSEVACGNASSTSSVAFAAGHVGSGLHYIVVDGVNGSFGTFDLEVSLDAENSMPDSCSSAELLDVGIEGTLSHTLDSALATNNSSSPSLALGNGPDLVYYFDAPAGGASISATLLFASVSERALLYLRKSCASGLAADELAAAWAPRGGPATLKTTIEAGRYYLWVDSQAPLKGVFRLDFSMAPPPANPGATCSLPLSLTLSGSSASAYGNSFAAPHASDGATCNTTPLLGRQVVYQLTRPAGLPRTGTEVLRATVTRGPTAKRSFQPAVAIRGSCAFGDNDQRACATTTTGTASATLANPWAAPWSDSSAYYIVVTSTAAEGDEYLLTVQLEAARPDTCSEAAALILDSNLSATFVASNSAATNKLDVYCPGGTGSQDSNGKDLVYRLDVTPQMLASGSKDLAVALSFFHTGAHPMIVVQQGTCVADTSRTATSALACVRPTSATGIAFATIPSIAAGTYFIWLDMTSYSTTTEPFTASVSLISSGSPAMPVLPKASCASATEIPPEAFIDGVATIKGDTTAGVDSDKTRCTILSSSGREVVYTLAIAANSYFDISVIPEPGSLFQPNVELRGACNDSSTKLSCEFANSTGKVARITGQVTESKEYALWVDSASATTFGPFTLRVRLSATAPAGSPDTCDDAIAAPLPTLTAAKPSQTFAGSLSGKAHQYGNSCFAPATATPDAVYQFTTDGNRPFSATLLTDRIMTSISLSLRKSDCASTQKSDELACVPAAAKPSLYLPSLPAGTYWLHIDASGPGVANSNFLLSLDNSAPTVAATCQSGMIPLLTPDPLLGKASLAAPVKLHDGVNNQAGSCAPSTSGMPGPERIFQVLVPANHVLTATVTPLPTIFENSFAPALYLRSTCASSTPASELACAYATSVTPLSATAAVTSATTLYVIVDSVDPMAFGQFTLDLNVAPVSSNAANDSCITPFPASAALSFNASYAAVSDFIDDARDSGSGKCASMPGPDKVYSFTLGEPRKVVITASASGFNPSIYLRQGCADALEVDPRLGCVAGTSSSEYLDLPELAEGTYYVWIDTTSASASGLYWLEVQTFPPATPVANEQCDFATELTFDGPLPATVRLSAAETMPGPTTNDRSPSCAIAAGPDAVYTFAIAPGTARKLEAKLQGKYLAPTLSLVTDCTKGSSVGIKGCATSPAMGAASTISHPYLAPGRYYLWVDSTNTQSRGAYELTVTLSEPTLTAKPKSADCTELESEVLTFAALDTLKTATFQLTNSAESGAWGNCGRTYGADTIYKLVLEDRRMITVELSGTPTCEDCIVALYLRKSCEDGSMESEMGCNANYASASLTYPSLDAGTYYIFLDLHINMDPASASGNLALKVTADVPAASADLPKNDTCAGLPVDLALTLGVPKSGDTTHANPDYAFGKNAAGKNADGTNGCDGATSIKGASAEVVYTYTTPATPSPFRVVMDATSTGGGTQWNGALWVGTSCADINSCVGSGDVFSGAKDIVNIPAPLPNQTYYIFAGGSAASDRGKFTILVESYSP